MTFEIIGDVDQSRLYCTGSFTKFLTTYACLSYLSEQYPLDVILDDDHFLDSVAGNAAAHSFLKLFQTTIGSLFSLRDVCTFYNGLPYTFDILPEQLEKVDQGGLFKHQGVMDEATFLLMCKTCITQVDPNRCKFHYSELAIIFLGYFIEKAFNISIEALYQKYVIDAFALSVSVFSRGTPANVDCQDLSDVYDYPAISIQDHGYFCYSNGFFTTLADQKKLLEQLIHTPIYQYMTDIQYARAASPHIMNGLTVELRKVGDDIVHGYEGLSYSGSNIWAYSTKYKKGYLTTTNSEELSYELIYQPFGYVNFDKVPEHTEILYHAFISTKHYDYTEVPIPQAFIGNYQRVDINSKHLDMIFTVAANYIEIRNPELVKYNVLYDHGIYRITCRDHMHGTKVGFYTARSGNRYMLFDGTLYRKI